MSVQIFELKQEHFLLLKNLRWSVTNEKTIINLGDNGDEIAPPFDSDNIYEAINLILNGKPDKIDLLSLDSLPEFTPEQKSEWDTLYSELPTALEIILQTGAFEVGIYKSKWHLRQWTKSK